MTVRELLQKIEDLKNANLADDSTPVELHVDGTHTEVDYVTRDTQGKYSVVVLR